MHRDGITPLSIASPDDSVRAFLAHQEELDRWAELACNEADTRAKAIDLVLKEILGWSEESITREDRTPDGGYLDYDLQTLSNRLVVEAKRAGAYFDMPKGRVRRLRRDGVLARSPTLHAALDQVVKYCRAKGVAVGAVTNGTQYALTLAYSSPGAARDDTILFYGLDDIAENYVLFWNLLAPSVSAESHLRDVLGKPDYVRQPPDFARQMLDNVQLRDEVIDRNPVDVSLAPLIRKYFADLTGEDHREVLQHAYVETGRQATYGRDLDALLTDSLPSMDAPVAEIVANKSNAPTLEQAFAAMSARDAASSEDNLLLLIGGVGAGKTSFSHRYFEFLISDQFREAVIPIFLDFTTADEDADNVSDFIDPLILRALEERDDLHLGEWETLQRIYERDIARLRKGFLATLWKTDPDQFWIEAASELKNLAADSEKHLCRLMEYIHRQGKQVCVVFDNVDQLSQEYQRRAIKAAFQKCRTFSCLGILGIREETYWRYRSAPPLDAYHRHLYHIAAPRIQNVLALRLEYAKAREGGSNITIRSERGLEWGGISVGQFLDILVATFLGDDHKTVLLLEALAANNVRLGLEMFSTFLTSGHTNTDEYIKTYILSGSYSVPFHSVLRSIGLGDYRYYDASRSRLDNLFALSDDGFFSHFQKIRVLRYLQGLKQIGSAPARGFVSISTIADAFRGLVIDEGGVRRILASMLMHRLVEAANGYRVDIDDVDLVKITSSGEYYLSTLASEFSYLDLVAFDTAIKSRERCQQLEYATFRGGVPLELIGERLEKVLVFIEYLVEEEAAEHPHLAGLGLPDHVLAPIMIPIRERFVDERRRITARAARYGSDRPR